MVLGPFGPLAPGGSALTLAVDPEAGWLGPALTDHPDQNPLGRTLFYRDWLATQRGGAPLAGPGYDAKSCAGCHIEMARDADRAARITPPLIARPVHPDDRDRLGPQIHRFRTDDTAPSLNVSWSDHPFTYPEGIRVPLRAPDAEAVYADGTRIPVTLRAAPLLFGWGLLERIDPAMLAYFDDPADHNGDGISGRKTWIEQADGRNAVGVLGWKNAHSDLTEQVRTALAHDMGITSASDCATGECTAEISEAELKALSDFVSGIGVPQLRPGAPRRGQDLFGMTGCAQCHVPVLQTLPDERPELDRQWIWAYTDLMLHDMGPALADDGPSPKAREWRTAPLWGVGLAERALPNRGFLHDGRAATLEEAVLWHGGEAEPARDAFAGLPPADREALLDFVRSL